MCGGAAEGVCGKRRGGRARPGLEPLPAEADSPSRAGSGPTGRGFPPALCPQGERATGFGVALLLALFGRASEDPLLNLVSPLGCEEDAEEGDVERDSKRRRLV